MAYSVLAHQVNVCVQPNTLFYLPLAQLFAPGSPGVVHVKANNVQENKNISLKQN